MKTLNYNFSSLVLLLAATASLASCGGGGGGGGSTPPAVTITSITPVGMVQSASSHAISLTGTNFSTGMTLSVTDSLGGSYAAGTVTALSSNVITSSLTVPSAPADRYVSVALKSSNGTTLATTILGVASASKTLSADIQPNIFNTYCVSCHSAGNTLVLNVDATSSAAALINTNSTGCPSRLRVTPGDPRRSKSVLIDKILTHSSGINPCTGVGMPADANVLTTPELTDIIDWVAGGAN
jgi:hypothetical protein